MSKFEGNIDDIRWNTAPDDLQMLNKIEEKIFDSHINTDVFNYYKYLKIYFLKLASMVKFDNEYLRKDFDELKRVIYTIDTNRDGSIDEFEARQGAVKLGKAFEKLEELHLTLSELKVESGFSVVPVNLKTQRARWKKREFTKEFPVAETE